MTIDSLGNSLLQTIQSTLGPDSRAPIYDFAKGGGQILKELKIKDNLLIDEDFLDIADDMAWATKKYEVPQYNKAAKSIINPDILESDKDWCYDAVNNWRAVHAFPLNTFQIRLRTLAKGIDPQCIIAQRTKRLSSISKKLERFPNMKMSQMQDIGGCRAIVSSVGKVNKLVELFKNSKIKHKLLNEDNYILNPKPSGYRGVHLIYGYYSDRNELYNGLKIEIQLRSLYQHAWATAVETVDTFTSQSLKSSKGTDEWLTFFKLMSSAISLKEKSPIIPNTPINADELKKHLKKLEAELKVRKTLQTFGSTIKFLEQPPNPNAHYFLIQLAASGTVKIDQYLRSELPAASANYLRLERQFSETDTNVVLVSADSLEGLRKAYPNYFLDTRKFIELIDAAIA